MQTASITVVLFTIASFGIGPAARVGRLESRVHGTVGRAKMIHLVSRFSTENHSDFATLDLGSPMQPPIRFSSAGDLRSRLRARSSPSSYRTRQVVRSRKRTRSSTSIALGSFRDSRSTAAMDTERGSGKQRATKPRSASFSSMRRGYMWPTLTSRRKLRYRVRTATSCPPTLDPVGCHCSK
jgi:hypothetical protein